MNRKLCVFVLLIGLYILSLSIEVQTRSSSIQKDSSTLIYGNSLDVYFFYGEGCPHCARVKPFLAEMEQKYPLQLHKYDIYNNRSCILLFDEYSNKYGLPAGRRGVPTLFAYDTYFVGDTPIIDGFEEVVKNALKERFLDYQNLRMEKIEISEKEVTSQSSSLSIPTITVAALVDSISPCSIGILIFLVGARVLVASQKKRILNVGLAFCLSIFIAYFLFGLGLLTFVQVSGFSNTFSLLVGLIAVLVGTLFLKDVFCYGKGGFTMEVPRSLKPLLMKMLKNVTSPTGAFIMGFIVACFELPCTSGPYLYILGQLANNTTRLQAVPLLLYYNFLFVLPLIIISMFLYSNILSIGKVRQWNEKNKHLLRLAGGLAMIALGLLTIPISINLQFVHSFLTGFKVVGPFLLVTIFLYTVISSTKHNNSENRLKGTLLLSILFATVLIVPSPTNLPLEPPNPISDSSYTHEENACMHGMANPAAVYCQQLGYEYKTVDTDKGEYGTCIFYDKGECEEWQFLEGKCGQSYSYCARQGYDLIVKTDGNDPFSKDYAVCVDEGKEIGSVTKLMRLREKAIKGTISVEKNANVAEERASTETLPPYFDWRDKDGRNWMTSVKDQGFCGSCWAFAAIGVAEAKFNIEANDPNIDPDLSEQHILSCSGVGSCFGGWPHEALNYMSAGVMGAVDEGCFPYTARDDPCDLCVNWKSRLWKIGEWKSINLDITDIKQALIEYGPLSIVIWEETHAVVLVGYNDTSGEWIFKNSYGVGYGDGGYGTIFYGGIDMAHAVLRTYRPPKNDMYMNGNIRLSPGTYNIDDTGQSGIIIINADNVELDCNGAILIGSGTGFGIYNNGHDNVTIKNCRIMNYEYGIYLSSSIDDTIEKNDVFNNDYNLFNDQSNAIKAELNWWGTTNCDSVDSKIYDNEEGEGEVDFIPFLDESYFAGIPMSVCESTPPIITISSPENKTYATTLISLDFTVNEPISWAAYSLDNKPNVTITGDTTLTIVNGHHSITIYASDLSDNIESSDIQFTVDALTPVFNYRQPIGIKNTANPEILIDYQVAVSIDTQSLISAEKMRTDCGDIRFTNSTSFDSADWDVSYPYWFGSECDSPETKIWVKIDYVPAFKTKPIFMYYGHSSASSESNDDAVFDPPTDWRKSWMKYSSHFCISPSGWTTMSYNDSSWDDIPYVNIDYWLECKWCDMHVRKKIFVTEMSSSEISISSDDGQWIYVNGVNVGHCGGDCQTNGTCNITWDITPYLEKGENVISVHCHQATADEECRIYSSNIPNVKLRKYTTPEPRVIVSAPPVHNLDTGLSYYTIQEAIDTPETLNSHTIQVDPGTYDENIDVHKSLNIYGYDFPIVNASNPDDNVFSILARANVSGFTITGATGHGYAGIYLGSGADYSTIINNRVSVCDIGMLLYGLGDANISENSITNSMTEGMRLHSSSYNVISNNNLHYNKYGIKVNGSGSSHNLIENNLFSENENGIHFTFYTSYNNIENNNVSNNDEAGIFVMESSHNLIQNNTVHKNEIGIMLWSSNDNRIDNNTITCNKYGILPQYSDSNTINGNQVCRNSEFDFYLYESYANDGTKNRCDKSNGWNDTGMIGCTFLCLLGDVDGNCEVSILDLRAIGNALGSTPEHPDWNPCADLKPDGKINVLDLNIVGKNFGKTC